MLWPFAVLFDATTRVRNWLFDRGLKSSYKHSKPTVGVGNLRVGGTGKTPMIEYLIRMFSDKSLVTLSRGYGRKTKGFLLADAQFSAEQIGDEPAQINAKFPKVNVAVSESRAEGLKQIDAKIPNHDLVLLDDVFQHRAVKPGLMIMLTTFSKPFFEDYVMPMGRLREARNGYKRADIIVVTKCPESLTVSDRNQYLTSIKPEIDQKIFFASEEYDDVVKISDSSNFNWSFEHQKIVLISGIASSDSLKKYLSQKGAIVHHFDFGDHHNYGEQELSQIIQFLQSEKGENSITITTEKDLQRLRLLRNFEKFAALSTYVLPMKMKILFDEEQTFQHLVLDYVNTNS